MKDYHVRWKLVLLALCYVFFLTSRLTMKNVFASRDMRSTELDTVYELSEDITVTVLGWTWSPSQGLMEVELEIINMREDLNRELTIEALYRETPDTRKGTAVPYTVVLDEGLYRVLWIEIGRDTEFSEVVLRITDPDGNRLSLYTNTDIITEVARIEKLTADGYIERRYVAALEKCRESVNDLEEQIEEKEILIANLEIINEELSSMHYSSEDEMHRTETLIIENRNKQEAYRREIEDLQDQIDRLRKQMEILQEKIDSFEGV